MSEAAKPDQDPLPDDPAVLPGRIEARFQPVMNAALWQNSVPMLTELSFVQMGNTPLHEVTIDLESQPPLFRPRSWRLQQAEAGQVRLFTDLDVQLDGIALQAFTEASLCSVTLTARAGADIVATFRQEVRVLAPNEWGGARMIPDILAAFVQPNEPAIAPILVQASDLLRAAGLDDCLEGYQSGKRRAWEQAQAIWSAICGLDIRYINPPASFVSDGQRIRSAQQIVAERLATCLDTTLLFASCLEAIGLRPLIVLQKGHAFAGLWLSKGDFGVSTVDDAPGIRTRLKLDDLRVFETTLATQSRKPVFQVACDQGEEQLQQEADEQFEAVIDVHRARQRRILPLPSRSAGDGFREVLEAEQAPPAIGPAPILREEPAAEEEPAALTPASRLQRWRNRLLDLSGRNRLLNLPKSDKQLVAIDCPDPAELENMLAAMRGGGRGTPLRFRAWPDVMTGADPRSAALHRGRLNEDAGLAYARQALAKRELMVGRGDDAIQGALTEIYRKSRADEQEGGSNTLFLTIGSLWWKPKNRDKPYQAPLILVPVVLERPSVRSGFLLRPHGDESRLNATLLEMLKQEFDIRFPIFEGDHLPEDESGLDVPKIIDIFRAKLRDVPGWEVQDSVALTNLSFTKFLMWKDLEERAPFLHENAVVRRLMDGPVDQPAAVSASSFGAGARHLDEALAAADLVCPMEADSSQLQAVARAAAGESFVLIGPPGTGKSQTITNIIANTLAQGRTVLFVAEKRTALEVVQRRLRQVGLADFCLDLFSSKASKMAVLEQLDRAQQAHEESGQESWMAARRDIAVLCHELNDYVRELHRKARNGWTPFRAIGLVLRAEAAAIPDVTLHWPNLDQHDAAAWQRLVEATEELAATVDRIGDVARAPALVGIEQPSWSPVWQTRLLTASAAAAARLDALARESAALTDALGIGDRAMSSASLLHLATLAALLLRPEAAEAGWAVSDQAEQTWTALEAEEARIARHHALWSELAGRWRPGVMTLPLGQIRTEWREAAGKWALPRALGLRALRKRLAAQAVGEVAEEVGADLDRLVELQQIDGALAAAPLAAIGHRWRGLATDFGRLREVGAWARAVRAATAACAPNPEALIALRLRLRRLLTETPDLLAPTGAIGLGLQRFLEVRAAAMADLDALGVQCGRDAAGLVDPARADWVPALARHLSGWSQAAPMIRDWCSWCGVTGTATQLGLGPLVRAVEDGVIASTDLVRVFEANYARWWIGCAVDVAPRLRSFVAAQHETRIERFRALDTRMLELASRLARARLATAIPGAAQRQHDPEFAVLTRELAKRQRHLPVRQLAQKMPKALRQLTPCLMMSPLSVAQYLPANTAQFDLVIFDEASQIPTWDAVGVVGRGRQVIIVGDPKQLPPTSFFERGSGDGEGHVEVETQDLDSILDECSGAGIPSIELRWHYRSRHESLIAFSNHVYYGGRLITFPSPVTTDTAVSFRFVADATYGRAADRTNPVEARAVVAEAVSILRRSPAPSLGIVTFNAEQQSLINDLLDKARRDDPALEPFFSDAAGEPVLVKNLEGVQGEERDVMLFSLTYGPDQVGKIGLNFGPLNLSGGERRLNVAITRAREQLVVFGSLRPEQIDLARTSAIGVKHLKQFLVFAEQGARAFAGMASTSLGDFESPFEAAVAGRLRDKGWEIQPQIGVSGFRVDLGIVDPDAPGSFLAGVECDGATYHSGATARDRDRLRQVVLEGLGWRILRIWSTDWWTNAAREAERLHQALQMALIQARKQRPERAERDAQIAAAVMSSVEAQQQEMPGGSSQAPVAAIVQDGIDPTGFYLDAYRPKLSKLVYRIIAENGPIRDDRLIQRVARLHGFGRIGREIRDRVLALLPSDCVRTNEAVGSFLWPPGLVPENWSTFRRPPLGSNLDPADLPLQELMALVASVRVPGLAEEQLLIAMRNACGMARMGESSRARFMEAIEATSR